MAFWATLVPVDRDLDDCKGRLKNELAREVDERDPYIFSPQQLAKNQIGQTELKSKMKLAQFERCFTGLAPKAFGVGHFFIKEKVSNLNNKGKSLGYYVTCKFPDTHVI